MLAGGGKVSHNSYNLERTTRQRSGLKAVPHPTTFLCALNLNGFAMNCDWGNLQSVYKLFGTAVSNGVFCPRGRVHHADGHVGNGHERNWSSVQNPC
eukprot:s1078_g2.t1